MDLWSINVKNTSNRGPFLLRNSIPQKPFSKWSSRSVMAAGISSACGTLRVVEIRVSRKRPCGYQSLMVRAMGKKNSDSSNSSSDNFSSSYGKDSSFPSFFFFFLLFCNLFCFLWRQLLVEYCAYYFGIVCWFCCIIDKFINALYIKLLRKMSIGVEGNSCGYANCYIFQVLMSLSSVVNLEAFFSFHSPDEFILSCKS